MTSDRVKRDCHCPRARHQHGTDGAYNADRCRCVPCTQARCRQRKHWSRRRDLIEQAGGSAGLVEGVGTRRRLWALAAVGWSTSRLAPQLGVTQARVSQLQNDTGNVRADLAVRVAAVYDRLWDQRPEWAGADRARAEAARRGWIVPAAWDDSPGPHWIDDPAAEPWRSSQHRTERARAIPDAVAVAEAVAGRRVGLTVQERRQAVHQLTALGLSAREIGERLGVTGRAVVRGRSAA